MVTATITSTDYQNYEISKHEVKYTLTKAGKYDLKVMIKPNRDGLGQEWFELSDSGFVVEALITTAHAPNTKLSGVGITDATAGIL